jgi:hypothetical protein
MTPAQAVDHAAQSLLPGGRDTVVIKVWGLLPPGAEIRSTSGLVMITPAPGFSVYIDDHPTANLFHPVRYAFVDAASEQVSWVDSQYPPANEEQYHHISTAIGEKLLATPNVRPLNINSKPPPPTRGDRWAVLMNGGFNQSNNHVRYWNDLAFIYCTLTQIYSYSDDHILALCSDGQNPGPDQSNGQSSNPDLDRDGDADIMYSCVLSNVDYVFSQLSLQMDPGDQLFIFTTDHGSSSGGWNASQNLWNTEILTDAHFASLLAALPTEVTIVCTFEPCYSGGFLDNVVTVPGPVVASSACAYNQLSYATSNLQYDEYVFHWTAAVNGHDAYGVEADADYNDDSIVTMDEAYLYAHDHDNQNEDPQYADEPSNVGMGISLRASAAQALLLICDQYIDDVGGNNNGMADPGEDILMRISLYNVGTTMATGVVGTLYTSDPYATITQNMAVWPNLAHLQQAMGFPEYLMTISPQCPIGHVVSCSLHVTADSGYVTSLSTSFMVGSNQALPTGPDAYGYRAWDDMDGGEAHDYAWMEIAPQHGGLGNALNWMNPDDGTQTVNLPFTFRYYGQNFTQLSVCTNGWAALGATTTTDYTNSGIPNSDGPPNMLALFWRDLHAGYGGSQIATYFNASQHYFVVEYDSVALYAAQTNRQTFEVIFYDPNWYPTSTGDGVIVVQYKRVTDASTATFGIENQTETIGLQYGFNGLWDVHASWVQNYRTITFSTNVIGTPGAVDITLTPQNPPIVIPAAGGSFNYFVVLTNNGASPTTFSAWVMQYTPQGTWQGPMLGPINLTLPGGVSITRLRTQSVPGTAPAGTYVYRGYVGMYSATKWDSSSFTYYKLESGGWSPGPGDWSNCGESFAPYEVAMTTGGERLTGHGLNECQPNPFNAVTAINYQLWANSQVCLQVYDLGGRLVATLADGWQEAGEYRVTFDGSRLASGLYFVRMQTGDYSAVKKMMLLK